MALRKADGTVIDKPTFQGATVNSTNAQPSTHTLAMDVYEDFDHPGGTTTRGRRLKYRAGQVITDAELQAVYSSTGAGTPCTVTTVSPTNPAVAGGTVVTLTGTGLLDVTGVTFAGTAGTSLTLISETKATVVAPAHAAGAADVVVQHPAGNVTKTAAVTYA